ncbi:MAG: hypothetical protein PHS32_05285 [Rhodoferax sp.]|uniref:hypothetical protein n=1 Tax=Rhodoferax sp. TaxID=50421 RepID=UPI00261BECC7|nr:hypothetical protein [Rhodoferax sp.]MDD5333141.1 hypothetical protein [Rhodoferax sp.]
MPSLAAEQQSALLSDADRFLVGFAAAHHRLPCPDTDRDGWEDCAANAQKGWLPYRTIGLEGAGTQAGAGELRYLVQRQAVDLAVAGDAWQPIKFKDNTDLYSARRTFTSATGELIHNIGSPDLCHQLTQGAKVALQAGHAQVNASPSRPVAYALAHPGSRDADGSGSLHDGANAAADNAFDAPERPALFASYDDRVTTRSYAQMEDALGCAQLNASLDQVSLATEVVEEVNSQKITNTLTAAALTAVAIVKANVAVAKTVMAFTELGTAIGYMTTAATLLASAIVGCFFLVGCAELPHAIATVVAAGISIVASSIAIAASITSTIFSMTAAVLTATAAIMAGASIPPNMDISSAVKQAQTVLADATRKKNVAYTDWQAAIAKEASLLSQKNIAVNNAHAAAHGIVSNANAAGNPVNYAIIMLDGYIDTAISRADDWMAAESNYNNAADAYKNAQSATGGGGAVGSNVDISAALAAIQTQIDAEADPVKKQKLIDAKAQLIASYGNSASNARQVENVNKQILALNTQINDLNTRIASNPSNVADLTTQRDQLVAQRDKLQAALSGLTLDVASALANKNAMDTARASAYNNYLNARNNAINASRLPYSVTTCTTTTGNNPVTTCTTTHKTYDGSSAMSSALNNLFGPSNDNKGLYFQWKLKQRQTEVAKAIHDQAVLNETQAGNALNSLSMINANGTGTGADVKPWSDADAILLQADFKGGMQ